jgi:hypothetical protein
VTGAQIDAIGAEVRRIALQIGPEHGKDRSK